jgi:hypothetical protein
MPSIPDVAAFISSHPYLACGAVFLLALSKAVPVVGAIVPGSSKPTPASKRRLFAA